MKRTFNIITDIFLFKIINIITDLLLLARIKRNYDLSLSPNDRIYFVLKCLLQLYNAPFEVQITRYLTFHLEAVVDNAMI